MIWRSELVSDIFDSLFVTLGLPLARKMDEELWELRSNLGPGIARTFFTIYESNIVLLHGFIKKSQKTPANELALAKRRLNKLRS